MNSGNFGPKLNIYRLFSKIVHCRPYYIWYLTIDVNVWLKVVYEIEENFLLCKTSGEWGILDSNSIFLSLQICSLDFSDIVPNDIDTVEDGTACALLWHKHVTELLKHSAESLKDSTACFETNTRPRSTGMLGNLVCKKLVRKKYPTFIDL